MGKKYDVIISQTAAQMLVSHAKFLAQVSEEAAEKLVFVFEKATDSLAEFPERCSWFNGENIPKNTYRFCVLDKKYILIFCVEGSRVYVDYVLDCRQNYEF